MEPKFLIVMLSLFLCIFVAQAMDLPTTSQTELDTLPLSLTQSDLFNYFNVTEKAETRSGDALSLATSLTQSDLGFFETPMNKQPGAAPGPDMALKHLADAKPSTQESLKPLLNSETDDIFQSCINDETPTTSTVSHFEPAAHLLETKPPPTKPLETKPPPIRPLETEPLQTKYLETNTNTKLPGADDAEIFIAKQEEYSPLDNVCQESKAVLDQMKNMLADSIGDNFNITLNTIPFFEPINRDSLGLYMIEYVGPLFVKGNEWVVLPLWLRTGAIIFFYGTYSDPNNGTNWLPALQYGSTETNPPFFTETDHVVASSAYSTPYADSMLLERVAWEVEAMSSAKAIPAHATISNWKQLFSTYGLKSPESYSNLMHINTTDKSNIFPTVQLILNSGASGMYNGWTTRERIPPAFIEPKRDQQLGLKKIVESPANLWQSLSNLSASTLGHVLTQGETSVDDLEKKKATGRNLSIRKAGTKPESLSRVLLPIPNLFALAKDIKQTDPQVLEISSAIKDSLFSIFQDLMEEEAHGFDPISHCRLDPVYIDPKGVIDPAYRPYFRPFHVTLTSCIETTILNSEKSNELTGPLADIVPLLQLVDQYYFQYPVYSSLLLARVVHRVSIILPRMKKFADSAICKKIRRALNDNKAEVRPYHVFREIVGMLTRTISGTKALKKATEKQQTMEKTTEDGRKVSIALEKIDIEQVVSMNAKSAVFFKLKEDSNIFTFDYIGPLFVKDSAWSVLPICLKSGTIIFFYKPFDSTKWVPVLCYDSRNQNVPFVDATAEISEGSPYSKYFADSMLLERVAWEVHTMDIKSWFPATVNFSDWNILFEIYGLQRSSNVNSDVRLIISPIAAAKYEGWRSSALISEHIFEPLRAKLPVIPVSPLKPSQTASSRACLPNVLLSYSGITKIATPSKDPNVRYFYNRFKTIFKHFIKDHLKSELVANEAPFNQDPPEMMMKLNCDYSLIEPPLKPFKLDANVLISTTYGGAGEEKKGAGLEDIVPLVQLAQAISEDSTIFVLGEDIPRQQYTISMFLITRAVHRISILIENSQTSSSLIKEIQTDLKTSEKIEAHHIFRYFIQECLNEFEF